MQRKVLKRSSDRVIAGVCGGIADYFGWPAWGVRLAYLFLSVLSIGFPGILIYFILWILMPPLDSN